jgi:hypothetical protein
MKEMFNFFLSFFKIFILISFFFGFAKAQNIKIEYSSQRVSLNESFMISIESEGMPIDEISSLPNIEGLKKIQGFISTTSSSNFEGETKKYYIKSKVYNPTREGTIRIPDFQVRVNGKNYNFGGTTLQVSPYDEAKGELTEWTYQDLFLKEEAKELIELKDEAFLGLSIDKTQVYTGEGFNVILSFYVAETNQAIMNFWELGKQIEEITRQLKPKNCWEENFEINELSEPIKININGKYYYQYVFYQASFFALNAENVQFQKVGLKMKVQNQLSSEATNTPSKAQDSLSIFKTFYSNSKLVAVKELPKHPLRDKVAVGSYYVAENYPQKKQNTGEDFIYELRIIGEGNISAIQQPNLKPLPAFEVYSPYVQQYINRGQNKVTGDKLFRYQVIPKEAGVYKLNDYFEWVYFNLNTQSYDTLRPTGQVKVAGKNMRNAEISVGKLNNFYKLIKTEDQKLISLNKNDSDKTWIEISVFLLLAATLFLIYRK